MTPADLSRQFDDYVARARALQAEYKGRLEIFVGMETEYCTARTLAAAKELFAAHALDYMVGSVHHVAGIPIDFSEELFLKAVAAHGSAEALFIAYFRCARTPCVTHHVPGSHTTTCIPLQASPARP